MKNNISSICKKHPQLGKYFLNISKTDINFSLDILKEVIEIYENEKFILRQSAFNIFEHKTLESIYDEMHKIIMHEKVKIFLKRETSLKTRSLFNNTTVRLLENAVLFGLNLDDLKSNFFNKLNSYATNKTFNNALKKYIEQNKEHDVVSILKKASSLNLNINLVKMDKEKQLLILQINDYEASSQLGSPSWCISYSKYQWDNYMEVRYNPEDRQMNNLYELAGIKPYGDSRLQFFVWDLNSSDHNKTMVGLTYGADLDTLLYSHERNDGVSSLSLRDYMSDDEISSYYSKIKLLINKFEHPTIDFLCKKLEKEMTKTCIFWGLFNPRRDDVIDYAINHLDNDKETKDYIIEKLIDEFSFNGTNVFSAKEYIKKHSDIVKLKPDFLLSLSKFLSLKFTYDKDNLISQIDECAKYFSSYKLESYENIKSHLIKTFLETAHNLDMSCPDHKLLVTNYLLNGALKEEVKSNIANLLIKFLLDSDDNHGILLDSIKKGIDVSYLQNISFVEKMSEDSEFCDCIFDHIKNYSRFHLEPIFIHLYNNKSDYFLNRLVNLLFENNLGLEPFLARSPETKQPFNNSYDYNEIWVYTNGKPKDCNDYIHIRYNAEILHSWFQIVEQSDFLKNNNINSKTKELIISSFFDLNNDLMFDKESILWKCIDFDKDLAKKIIFEKYPRFKVLLEKLDL